MQLLYERLIADAEEGFIFKRIRTRQHYSPWHFHLEHELILTLNCPGYRLVGDDICPLKSGDLVLLGSNLPHLWQCERAAGRPTPPVEMLLVQFRDNFLGAGGLDVPAFLPVRQLLHRARLGLVFSGKTRDDVQALLEQMNATTGLSRLVLFLRVLARLALSTEAHPLASPGFTAAQNPFNQDRMSRVFQYIEKNLGEALRLQDAAREAHLSEGAFSRFFHQHTGRTFPEFVNQLRVGRACHFLASTDLPVTEIALSCGFANLSNFNRQFLRLKKITPRDFRKKLQPH